MDDPIPIEGIIEGDPAALAAVCAAGGSAIGAYCAVLGAQAHAAETAVAALASFRRGVVANAQQEPSQLELLLLAATDRAARDVAGVTPSPLERAAAQSALEQAVTGPLPPGLAPRIIRALVDAAPVTALGGDVAAVRRAAEEHYVRSFDGGSATQARSPQPPGTPAAAWVPTEILTEPASYAGAPLAEPGWHTPAGEADAPSAVPPPGGEPADAQSAAPATAPATDATTAPPAREPGTLVIKRGGHWPFRRRPRPPSPVHRGAGARGRSVLLAGAVGLALGAGIGVVAAPERTVERDPVLVRPLDTPFAADGAVFNVARTGTASWARAIRRQAPRAGRTWVTLAAQTRNVSRRNFRPRGLGFRIRTAAGIVVGPETALVAGAIPAIGGRLATGRRTSVHLAFQVPSGAPGLTLEFDPGPRSLRVRVPLN